MILIGDSEDMTRKGLSLMIEMEITGHVIAEADSCQLIMSELSKKKITHLVLDTVYPDGNVLEILPEIKRMYPALKILFFTIQPPQINGEILKLFNTPYYLSKTADNTTIVNVLKIFLKTTNNIFFDMNISPDGPFKTLTPREQQVLYYLLNGLGTKQISETLHLKMNSISTLKKRIFQKTGAPNFKVLIDLCNLHEIKH